MEEKLKTSEARIIIFLKHASTPNRYTRNISTKLKIDYGYILRILKEMQSKEWVEYKRVQNKAFYSLTEKAPYEQAQQKLNEENNKLENEAN